MSSKNKQEKKSGRPRGRPKGKNNNNNKTKSTPKGTRGQMFTVYNQGTVSAPMASYAPVRRWHKSRPFRDGKDSGVVISGCIPWAQVSGSVTDGGFIKPFSSGIISKVADLCPATMFPTGSIEQQTADCHTRYCFTKAKVIWSGFNQGTTVGSFSLGYYQDGTIETFDINPSDMPLMHSYSIVPVWVPQAHIDITDALSTRDWFYVNFDIGTSEAGQRQSFQGGICGIVTSSMASLGTIYGLLYLEYELRLVQERPVLSLSLAKRNLQPHRTPRPLDGPEEVKPRDPPLEQVDLASGLRMGRSADVKSSVQEPPSPPINFSRSSSQDVLAPNYAAAFNSHGGIKRALDLTSGQGGEGRRK